MIPVLKNLRVKNIIRRRSRQFIIETKEIETFLSILFPSLKKLVTLFHDETFRSIVKKLKSLTNPCKIYGAAYRPLISGHSFGCITIPLGRKIISAGRLYQS